MTRSRYIHVPADTRRFHWKSPTGPGSFRPNGELTVEARGSNFLENPTGWSTRQPMYAARIFVGFNVGQRPRWKMDDAVRIVKRVRKAQVGAPDATFLYQRGLYTSTQDKSLVDEKGAQIILLNLAGASAKEFRAQMIELGEELATVLKQESVIVEIQKGGVSKETIGITPVRRAG